MDVNNAGFKLLKQSTLQIIKEAGTDSTLLLVDKNTPQGTFKLLNTADSFRKSLQEQTTVTPRLKTCNCLLNATNFIIDRAFKPTEKHSPCIRSTVGARESWELRCSFPGWAGCSLDSGKQTESRSTAGSTAGPHGHGNLQRIQAKLWICPFSVPKI